MDVDFFSKYQFIYVYRKKTILHSNWNTQNCTFQALAIMRDFNNLHVSRYLSIPNTCLITLLLELDICSSFQIRLLNLMKIVSIRYQSQLTIQNQRWDRKIFISFSCFHDVCAGKNKNFIPNIQKMCRQWNYFSNTL